MEVEDCAVLVVLVYFGIGSDGQGIILTSLTPAGTQTVVLAVVCGKVIASVFVFQCDESLL